MYFTPWHRSAKSLHLACREFAARLDDIELPLNASDPVTRQLVAILLSEKLGEVLDAAFGPVLPNRMSCATGLPWFEQVDEEGSDQDHAAEALLDLFDPSSRLFRILTELTVIDSASFVVRLSENWKNEYASSTADALSDSPFGTGWLSIPLSVICSNAYSILAEPLDAKLAELPVDRVPPFLVLPLWRPPLVNEMITVADNQRDRYTCVPVGPAIYLILRMLAFMPHAVSKHDAISDLAPPMEESWTKRFHDLYSSTKLSVGLLSQHNERNAVSDRGPRYRAYFKLVSRYVSHLCSSQPFGQRPSAPELLGAGMLHALTMVWQRLPSPFCESDRVPTNDLAQLSILLHAVPLIDQLIRQVPPAPVEGRSPQRFHLVRSFDEVIRPSTSVYRTALRLLRQVLLSVPTVFRLPEHHTLSVLRLCVALIDSGVTRARSAGSNLGIPIGRQLVVLRYEVFSVILSDLLDVLLDCSAFFSAEHFRSTAVHRALLDIFAPLADAEIHGCLEAISKEVDSLSVHPRAQSPLTQQVVSSLVLNWSSDGSVQSAASIEGLFPVTTGMIAAKAVRLSELLSRLDHDYSDVVSVLHEAFPGYNEGDRRPFMRGAAVTGPQESSMNVSLSTLASEAEANRHESSAHLDSSCFPEHGRRIRLRNKSSARDESASRSRVPANTFDVSQRLFLSADIVYSRGTRLPRRGHEIARLLELTELLDSFIQWLQDLRAVWHGTIPRCPRGHRMRLDERIDATKLWMCEKCTYACDQPTLQTSLGYTVEAESIFSPSADDAAVCERCCLFLDAPRRRGAFRRFRVPLTEAFLCPDCACRPYPRISLRLLASRYTYVAALFVAMLLLLLWLWFTSSPSLPSRKAPQWGPAIEDVDDMA